MVFSDSKPKSSIPLSSTSHQTATQHSFFDRALAMHIDGIMDSLRYMPDGGYKKFCQQLLAHDTHARSRWLRLNTTMQTIVLTHKMLDGLLSTEEIDYLLPYIVTINTFFFYENISDHLSIGLAYQRPNDETYKIRHQIIHSFNEAISNRIRDRTQSSAQALLIPAKPLINEISSFDQSLNRADFQRIAESYLSMYGTGVSRQEIEFSVFSSLIANIETCLAALNVLREYETFPLMQDRIARRYESMNCLMQDAPLSFEELVVLGTDTVLVEFATGYYIALIAEQVRPMRPYSSLLEDGTLAEGLRDAALLVRLLDDVGTRVLENPREHKSLISMLRNTQKQQQHPDFYHLLLRAVEENDTVLTRLKKDLVFGESNVLLYASLREDKVSHAIDLFETHLEAATALYHERKRNLNLVVKRISERIGGAIISEMLIRFVRFHEVMYSESFEKGSEYAI